MKILLGVLYYEPAWAYGGPPRMVHGLAHQLAARGHQVTVLTTDALDGEHRVERLEESGGGVRVVRFRNLSNQLAWRTKIFLPVGLRRWVDEHVSEFDVVHLFDARTMLNAWAALAANRRGVPFVVSAWGSLPEGEGWKRWLKRLYDRRVGPVQFGRASSLLAQNDHEGELYRQYGGASERIELWPLAVDPAEYAELPERGTLRARHGIASDERVVLFVGRIHALKGLDPLLRAFAEANVPRSRLVIVGRDDGYLDEMHALARSLGIADRLTFVGPLYGRDTLAAYVDCDLFAITPTHFEETSLASLAACACGRPILINDRCDVPWLDEYQAGRSVPHSVENLARAMREMLADPGRLEEMGRNARRLIDERFLWARVVEQVESIYARALAQNGSARATAPGKAA